MRALRILLIVLAVVIGLPVALLLIVFAAAQTGPGKRLIADQAGSLASSPEMQVSVGAIEGFVPFDMTVRDVAVSDPAGKMVTVDWARLAWSPSALLRRTLRVDAVEAGTVTVDRLPAGGAEPEPEPSSTGFSLPRLPVDIRLDRLNVERIAVGPAVAGLAATLSVAGDAQLGDPSQGLAANLAVRRLDGAAGDITARLAFIPSTEQLDVAVSVQEPPGGLIASMAQFPGQPPVDLKLNGTGTLRDWRATLTGKVGDLGGVEGQVRIEPGEGRRRLTVDLNADAARLVPAALAATAAPLLQGRTTLKVEAEIADAGPITIRQLDAKAAAGSVSITGSVNPTGNQVDLAYTLQAGAAAGFATLLPPGTGWDVAGGRRHRQGRAGCAGRRRCDPRRRAAPGSVCRRHPGGRPDGDAAGPVLRPRSPDRAARHRLRRRPGARRPAARDGSRPHPAAQLRRQRHPVGQDGDRPAGDPAGRRGPDRQRPGRRDGAVRRRHAAPDLCRSRPLLRPGRPADLRRPRPDGEADADRGRRRHPGMDRHHRRAERRGHADRRRAGAGRRH